MVETFAEFFHLLSMPLKYFLEPTLHRLSLLLLLAFMCHSHPIGHIIYHDHHLTFAVDLHLILGQDYRATIFDLSWQLDVEHG